MKKMLIGGVMALSAAMILAACSTDNPAEKDSSVSSDAGTVSTDLPQAIKALEADGKMVFAFKLGTDEDKAAEQNDPSVASLPSYVSPYLTGSFAKWGTSTDAVELKAVAGAEGYYAAVIDWTYDPSTYTGTEGALEYSIVLGYNSTAGLSADKTGLLWVDAYKSYECAQYAYPKNAAFTYTAGDKLINLGTHHFTSAPAQPVVLFNYKATWTFTQEIASYVDLYVVGSFNGWNTTFDSKYKLTRTAGTGENPDVWTATLGDVIKGADIAYKLVATNSKLSADAKNFWTYGSNVIGDDTNGNAKLVPIADDDYEEPITNIEFAKLPGDPNAAVFDLTVNVTISDYDAASTVYSKILFNGSVNGWNAIEGTVDATNKKFTYKFEGVAAGSYEFGLKVCNAGGTQIKWVAGTNGSNAALTMPAEETTLNYTASLGDFTTPKDDGSYDNSNTIALATEAAA